MLMRFGSAQLAWFAELGYCTVPKLPGTGSSRVMGIPPWLGSSRAGIGMPRESALAGGVPEGDGARVTPGGSGGN